MTTRRGSARGGSSGSSGCGAGSKGSGKGGKGSGKGPQRWEPPLRSLFEIPMTMFDGTAMRKRYGKEWRKKKVWAKLVKRDKKDFHLHFRGDKQPTLFNDIEHFRPYLRFGEIDHFERRDPSA